MRICKFNLKLDCKNEENSSINSGVKIDLPFHVYLYTSATVLYERLLF